MDYYNTDFVFSDLETGQTLYTYIEYLHSFHGPASPKITDSLDKALSESGSGTKIFKLTVEELNIKEVEEVETVTRYKRILE